MIQWEHIPKRAITQYKWLLNLDLGNLGKSVILYEKAFYKWIRADVSIFSHNKGLICIEIKNSHDNLRRLRKELKGYQLIANYIYVMTSENHLKGVNKIVHALHMQSYVGIIEYSIVNKSLICGIYKSAHYNNHFNITALMWVMWKPELMRLLIANYGHTTYQPSKQGLSYKQYETTKRSFFKPNQPTKRLIIETMEKLLGYRRCLQLVTDMFVYNDQEPQKPLNKAYFKS